jgi:hypothetical protein
LHRPEKETKKAEIASPNRTKSEEEQFGQSDIDFIDLEESPFTTDHRPYAQNARRETTRIQAITQKEMLLAFSHSFPILYNHAHSPFTLSVVVISWN